MVHVHDAVIVGAGPGGSATAHCDVACDPAAKPGDFGEKVHGFEHAQSARGETVAAGFVARKARAIEQQNVETLRAEKVGGGRATRAGAYDDRIMHVHHAIG